MCIEIPPTQAVAYGGFPCPFTADPATWHETTRMGVVPLGSGQV